MPHKERKPEQPFDLAELMERECPEKSPDDLQHIRLAIGFSVIVGEMIEKAQVDTARWMGTLVRREIAEHEARWHAQMALKGSPDLEVEMHALLLKMDQIIDQRAKPEPKKRRTAS